MYYNGTKEQWNQIKISGNSDPLIEATFHFHEHTEEIIPAVPATTTATGLTEGKKCSVCGEIIVAQQVTPMIQTGWVKVNNKWAYRNTDGNLAIGPQVIDGIPYCFNSNGEMVTGWALVDGKWYYAQASGALYNSGWMDVNGTWYYFKANGEMATGWINDGGTYYFMNDSGTMATGWVKDGKDWYYMSDSGAMYTGWLKSGGSWYLLKPNGAMAKGWVSDSGTWYYFTSSGIMKTGWFEDKEAEAKLPEGQKRALWYWFDNSGNMAKGWKEINGQWEMFADSGEWLYTWDGN